MRELKSIGAKQEEMDIVYHLLLILSKDVAIMTALEALEIEKLILDFVKVKLLDREIKNRINRKLFQVTSAAFSNNLKTAARGNHNKQHVVIIIITN